MKGAVCLLAWSVSLVGTCLPAGAQAAPGGGAAVRSLKGFNVILLVGDAGNDGTPNADMPSSAKAAIEDIRALLPFKRYQMVDSVWLSGSLPRYRATGRVRGPNREEYQVSVKATPPPLRPEPTGAVYVTFDLQEVSGESTPPPQVRSTRVLLETSFTMRIGETVVVGTSSARPGVGLIALLNAVAER